MDGDTSVREIVVELNPGGTTLWRARIEGMSVVVGGSTVGEAQSAAVAAVTANGAQLAEDLVVRVRYGTRAQRLAAGWLPPQVAAH